jgi:hypothetical protein
MHTNASGKSHCVTAFGAGKYLRSLTMRSLGAEVPQALYNNRKYSLTWRRIYEHVKYLP